MNVLLLNVYPLYLSVIKEFWYITVLIGDTKTKLVKIKKIIPIKTKKSKIPIKKINKKNKCYVSCFLNKVVMYGDCLRSV